MDPKGAGSELQERRGAIRRIHRPLIVLALASLALGAVRASAAAPSPVEPPSYARDVAPLFARWCVSCHGGSEAHGGLWLDSLAGVMRGGDTGPVVIAGDPKGSLLVAKVERRHRPAMPPRRKLPGAGIRLIRAWVAAGAPG
jgi:mono/diheme cytochrome c family protein